MSRLVRGLVLGFAIVATASGVIGTATYFGWVPALWLPTIGALLPLLPLAPARARTARIVSTVLISVFAILGAFTVGMFFVPGAIAMGMSVALISSSEAPEASA